MHFPVDSFTHCACLQPPHCSLTSISTYRKGVAKAQAKHEPTVFRDELLRLLSTCPSSTDWEGYLRILESAANELDVRKYDSAFFELLILGKLLAPGGAVLADGAEASPFSVLGRDLNQQKDVAAVFAKLIRR